MDRPTFEDLPTLIGRLISEVEEMKSLLVEKTDENSKLELPINIKEVSTITGLTKSTLYKYCQDSTIPYYKRGNRNFFFKSEIIDWIKEGKNKTLKEINKEAEDYLADNRRFDL